MNSTFSKKDEPNKRLPLIMFGPWDILSGLPAGALIFMGTILFSTFTAPGVEKLGVAPLFILAIMSFFVGVLAGFTRLAHGPATALCAGVTAAGILFYLWTAARPGELNNAFVFSPTGMIVTIIICPIGGWVGAKTRKAL